MTHTDAPLTPARRLRLVLRGQDPPIAHLATEAGGARVTPHEAGAGLLLG